MSFTIASQPPLLQFAYHEVAHATAMDAMGSPWCLIVVTSTPQGKHVGVTQTYSEYSGSLTEGLAIAVAGHVAERRYLRARNRIDWTQPHLQEDKTHIEEVVTRRGRVAGLAPWSGPWMETYISPAWNLAYSIMRKDWGDVTILAKAMVNEHQRDRRFTTPPTLVKQWNRS
jgi:hypothetical protein